MNDLINAELVYDYSTNPGVIVPEAMMPKANSLDELSALIKSKGQLQGTHAEVLSEVASRVCYDSLGTGRDSAGLHVHLKEVGHGSVYEHYNFTVTVQFSKLEMFSSMVSLLASLINRPGVWVRLDEPRFQLRITLNLRSILEWDKVQLETDYPETKKLLGYFLKTKGNQIAPQVISAPEKMICGMTGFIVEPESDEECWVTMYVSGSRGFSHEQIRHRFRTAISQRSTRYVNESGSPWVQHPLITKFIEEGLDVPPRAPNGENLTISLAQVASHVKTTARHGYGKAVEMLQAFMLSKGVDKLTARKQARGAARGFLGNALQTELIFSASVAQWKRILQQRLNAAADAEIREMAAKVLIALKGCRYKDRFSSFTTKPSPDGIGEVLNNA